MSTPATDLAADVAAASAAYLFNLLPGLAELPAPEAFQRLQTHFETAIVAYLHAEAEGLPECITEEQHRIARRYTKLLTGMKDRDCPDAMYRALAWMLVVYEGERLPKLLTPSRN